MSKRVLLMLAVGILVIVAAFFVYKHELKVEETDPETETEPAKKPIKKKDPEVKAEAELVKAVTDEPAN